MADDSVDERNALLESALSTAFSVIDAPRVTPTLASESSSTSSSSSEEPVAEASATSESSTGEEQWKKDYDSYVEGWKAESAVAREKAERTRAEWEAKRQAEGGGKGVLSEEEFPPLAGPPNPHFSRTNYPASPSPADARDSVSGEPSGHAHISQMSSFASVAAGEANSPPASQALEQSSHWEEVSSMQSSLSFPEQSKSVSPEPVPKSTQKPEETKSIERTEKAAPPAPAKTEPPPSASLSVFDSRLSTRSRTIALITSFAINLALPFVNGVMLGFGEIFARTLLARWGWNVPGGAATAVGFGAASKSKRR
ncbi:hypothetical protein SCHPADRAFT_940383 [Schizopora paradoxa]|uniref:TOM13-domain-containing protein n=1 Tax=Schizopora paradoxa TaxID=27342 RepID=A0A0H2RVN7_9AGAM|nr:hypothetical protein SCHPADRAFT_940383 [Schizopora paradoxa]